jgi:4'-phosphopantetheinyl transferase
MKEWPFPPASVPQLGRNVHVWRIELEVAAFDPSVWQNRLSLAEQARAMEFRFERDRRRFIVAHAALRQILARYVKNDPAELHFLDGPRGKPKLGGPLAASSIRFNLSHSHERALLAVSGGTEIGVDIEFVSADFEFHEIAKHFFTAREVAALDALPPTLQRHAFYKCWTSKEAFLKAKGTGLSGELDEVEIKLAGQRHVQIGADVAGWSLVELDSEDDYEAALVIQRKPVEIFCYRWEAPDSELPKI